MQFCQLTLLFLNCVCVCVCVSDVLVCSENITKEEREMRHEQSKESIHVLKVSEIIIKW